MLGYGTVGSGVVEVLSTNSSSIATRAGQPIEVKSVLDIRDFPGDPIQEKIVHDLEVVCAVAGVELVDNTCVELNIAIVDIVSNLLLTVEAIEGPCDRRLNIYLPCLSLTEVESEVDACLRSQGISLCIICSGNIVRISLCYRCSVPCAFTGFQSPSLAPSAVVNEK